MEKTSGLVFENLSRQLIKISAQIRLRSCRDNLLKGILTYPLAIRENYGEKEEISILFLTLRQKFRK